MNPLPESPKLPFYACLKGCSRDRLPHPQNTWLNCPSQIPWKMFLKRVLPKATWGYLSVLKDSINEDAVDLDKDWLKPEIKIKTELTEFWTWVSQLFEGGCWFFGSGKGGEDATGAIYPGTSGGESWDHWTWGPGAWPRAHVAFIGSVSLGKKRTC